jgi:hypothetical protein
MANPKKVLLVEGESDKGFFEEICKKLSLDTSVIVSAPKELGGKRNSKEGVKNVLKELLPQLNDGRISHIAVVVDADHQKHGNGFQTTLDSLSAIVEESGFKLEKNSSSIPGLFFKNSDGLEDIGLWIMPDNRRDGMLEDCIKSSIHNKEVMLFKEVEDAVQKVSAPRFSAHSRTKVEVATWLAWQKQPGHGLYAVITDNLLDDEHPLFKELKFWLLKVFSDDKVL